MYSWVSTIATGGPDRRFMKTQMILHDVHLQNNITYNVCGKTQDMYVEQKQVTTNATGEDMLPTLGEQEITFPGICCACDYMQP